MDNYKPIKLLNYLRNLMDQPLGILMDPCFLHVK